jgi:hypothetical protein
MFFLHPFTFPFPHHITFQVPFQFLFNSHSHSPSRSCSTSHSSLPFPFHLISFPILFALPIPSHSLTFPCSIHFPFLLLFFPFPSHPLPYHPQSPFPSLIPFNCSSQNKCKKLLYPSFLFPFQSPPLYLPPNPLPIPFPFRIFLSCSSSLRRVANMQNCITSRAANWRPKYYIRIFIVYVNKDYTKTNGKTCSYLNWIKLLVQYNLCLS